MICHISKLNGNTTGSTSSSILYSTSCLSLKAIHHQEASPTAGEDEETAVRFGGKDYVVLPTADQTPVGLTNYTQIYNPYSALLDTPLIHVKLKLSNVKG